jgi:hypothetical protein
MANKLRVFVDRKNIDSKFNDLNIVTINDFTPQKSREFFIELKSQLGTSAAEVLYKRIFTPSSTTTPPPPPPVTEGALLWSSLRDGKWDQKRVVDDSFGNIGPNGKGFHMRASGNPKLDVKGNNEAWLVCEPGHGRMYGAACNYNAILKLDFNFMNDGVDNLSLKLRSRHQMGGAAEHRFGGCGCSISLDDVGFKTEDYHNVHSASMEDDLVKKLEVGKWYTARFACVDSPDRKAIEFDCDIDYQDGKGFINVLSGKNSKPKPYFMDKASFDKHSEFWIRMNNESDGTIGLRNVTLTAV